MGFGVPIDAWLRGPLRGWAEDLLDRKPAARVRASSIRRRSAPPGRDHLSGRRNCSTALWTVLMFQAWLDEQRAVGRPT